MLKFLVVSSCLLAIAFGLGESTSSESTSSESTSSEKSTGETSSGETTITTTKAAKSNYYQTTYNGQLYVPYAIGKCSATSAATSIMPTCTDTSHVSVTTYSAATDCTGASTVANYNSSSHGTNFKCDGTTTYSEVTLGVSGSCFLTFYAALDSCTQYSTASTAYYSTFTCSSSSKGFLKLFTTSACSSTSAASYNFTSTCSAAFTFSTITVYGEINSCSSSSVTTTGAGTTTTSSGATTTSSGATTTSSTTSDANMIGLKNIVGIFIMIACIIAKL